MERKSWKRLALLIVASIPLAGGGLAHSAAGYVRPGTYDCPYGEHEHYCKPDGSPRVLMSTQGSLSVEAGESFTTSDGRQGTHLEVLEIQSVGSMEGFGDVTFTLDTSRTVGSTIIANQTDTDFPATQTMRFYPKITINGEDLLSSEPAQVVNSEVTGFPSPPGTTYVLTHELKMTNEAGNVLVIEPGKAFTVGKKDD